MKDNRRNFIKQSAGLAGAVALGTLPTFLSIGSDEVKITILHTNDTHSRIDPFPDDGRRNAGLGGIARRAAVIKKIRKEEKNVLLLDAGDILQGTPYFNFFKGEVEFKMMSEMGYNASTIGNHEFDNGVQSLANQMVYAKFPFICSNYGLVSTPLAGKTIPRKIFTFEGIRVGVFGLGIELNGLVLSDLCEGVVYQDPITIAKQEVEELRTINKCHVVICLSHLGLDYKGSKVDDVEVAKKVDGIDLIIGGHTHTFMDSPKEVINPSGSTTLINQVGFGGIIVGKINIFLKKFSSKKTFQSSLIEVSKKSI